MEGIKYVNLIEVGSVVIEIQGVVNSKLAVPVNVSVCMYLSGYECMHVYTYVCIYVTVSAKTILNSTFGIMRNTILKHWNHCSFHVLDFSCADLQYNWSSYLAIAL